MLSIAPVVARDKHYVAFTEIINLVALQLRIQPTSDSTVANIVVVPT